ncbi:MAG TPA: asparagine synthase (glutamine-hydrolyzing) [Planctomycetaceae bacterium]|nr:asparagine synthase (glutamine-hydrolyzing) [Planctomycetaceae bacterium]HIQ19971.1 asparagine synthase (glutamine-hydrolyzing) [Planctomycetota bacterium]
MCGITGAVWTDPARALDEPTLRRMVRLLRHRGPDDEGLYVSRYRVREGCGALPGVALGHRRLSIIDVAGGHQPMANETGSIWVVFNGEIYNHRQLRRRLEGTGHRFATRSDTEVLVHLYEDEGANMLKQLNGMFALAVWDGIQGRLLLARDRLGQKPLVYRIEPGRLLFASELKSLLELPEVPRQIDPQAVDLYLTYQYVPHPWTIFRGICKLPPAHYGVYCDGQLSVYRYWQPDFNVEEPRPAGEYAAELRQLLGDAVGLRLQSEVPLGAFLSGGTDSTIVVGLMCQQASEPVRTFSIGFPVAEYDETRYAQLVAQRLGTRHEQFRVEPDAVAVLDQLVWHYDEPFADSSAIPTWYVSQLTRQHVTVALSGDGGDELFAGYPRYRAVWLARAFDRIPSLLRRLLAGPHWQKLPASARQKSLRRRLKRFGEVLNLPPHRRYLEWIAIFNEWRRAELYTDDFVASLPEEDPFQFLAAAFRQCRSRDPVTATSLADLMTYLPCDLMTKVDIASMAHGLECRQPFLDYRVVELAARMPLREKFRLGRGKRILLDAFADLVPPAVRRRPKMGFGVPLDHWFRGPLATLARDVLTDRKTATRGLFQPTAVRRLLEDHIAGRFDHSYRLWALLVLELWHRRWVDR